MKERKASGHAALRSSGSLRQNVTIELKEEPSGILEHLFEQYGSCVIQGCEPLPDRITPGVAALAGIDDGLRIFRVVRFPGARHEGNYPYYLSLRKTELSPGRGAGSAHPVACRYEAQLHDSHPGIPCLIIGREGAPEFSDRLRDELFGDGNPISPTGAVSPISESVPAGTVQTYAGTEIPRGWLPCDGRYLDPECYPALFGALGDRFGNCRGKFRIPDLRGGFIRGLDHSIHAALTYIIRTGSSSAETSI